MNWKRLAVYGLMVVAAVGVMTAFWLTGQLEGLCSAADRDAVECIRNWVNPATAALTVAAIIYASRQVLEAGRQSNAAVRQSMVMLRDDLIERIDDALKIRSAISDTMLSELIADETIGTNSSGAREKEEQLRRWMEDFSYYDLLMPLRQAEYYNPDIRSLANKLVTASAEIDERLGDVRFRFPMFLFSITLQPSMKIPELEEFALHELEWAGILQAHHQLTDAVREYLQALEKELQAVALLITDLDATVLADARKLVSQRQEMFSHRLGYVDLEKRRAALKALADQQ